ncbi:MAG: acyl-CoA dehydratase activase, partial [Bacteroidales bacterium]|nr:acyl-CoA dehydratase activase [Bacteroidales bacterium]
MISAGIDIGSRTIKLVLWDGEKMLFSHVRENTFNTLEVCAEMLAGKHYDVITATGYGRHLFADKYPTKVVSEITAFAVGINTVNPFVRTVLDIGGQDTKAIAIDAKGQLMKFEMNDKCAAGTGRFFEIMAMALRYDLDTFGNEALAADKEQNVNSMCTVFAESEVISLLAQGADRAKIAKGIHLSVIRRATSLLKRVGVKSDVAFVGGVAKNPAMVPLLSDHLKVPVYAPKDPQIIG